MIKAGVKSIEIDTDKSIDVFVEQWHVDIL